MAKTVLILPLIFLILQLICQINGASLSIYEQKKYKRTAEVVGLYSTDDDVEILTKQNFKERIYNNEHIWLVEFYNSWCGFCQRFAPSWKALATDLVGWKDKILIGAIDCSNEDNYNLCRDFEIMAYPTLKYFHENYKEGEGKLGDKIFAGNDVHEHRQKLLEKLVEEQLQKRATQLPSLLPFNSSSLNGIVNDKKFAFLIVEEPDSFIGSEVIMDFNKHLKDFTIRRAFNNNSDLVLLLKVEKVPSLYVVKKDLSVQLIENAQPSREGFNDAIRHYLANENINIPQEKRNNTEIFTGKWKDVQVPSMEEFLREKERQALKERVKQMGDVVFQVDLESALRYSLKHEIGTLKTIEGDKLEALKKYIHVLAKYFPFGRYGRIFLHELDETISKSNSIEGKIIADAVSEAEKENKQVFSSQQQWLGCMGSSKKYRGYPCGLWKLFHYLTINAAIENRNSLKSNPKEILDTMRAYIKNYFGCADCANHFLEMAKRRNLDDVNTWEKSIIWLWDAHNEVNNRLKGDATEDPEFPKTQFPTRANCQQCYYDDGSFNIPEVTKYLKHMYSSINVRYLGSDTRVLHAGLDGSSSGAAGLFQTIDKTRLPQEDVRTRSVRQSLI